VKRLGLVQVKRLGLVQVKRLGLVQVKRLGLVQADCSVKRPSLGLANYLHS